MNNGHFPANNNNGDSCTWWVIHIALLIFYKLRDFQIRMDSCSLPLHTIVLWWLCHFTTSYIRDTEVADRQVHGTAQSEQEVTQHINIDQPDHAIDLEKPKILQWNQSGSREVWRKHSTSVSPTPGGGGLPLCRYISWVPPPGSNPSPNRDGGRYNLTAVCHNAIVCSISEHEYRRT